MGIAGMHYFRRIGIDLGHAAESLCALLGRVVPTLGEGFVLGVMRVIRMSSRSNIASREEVIEEDVPRDEQVIRGREILGQNMGPPQREVLAGVCYGRMTVAGRRLRIKIAIFGSGYEPDRVRRCCLIQKDKSVFKVLRVEVLTDGQVRHIVEVGTIVDQCYYGGITELGEASNVEIVVEHSYNVLC